MVRHLSICQLECNPDPKRGAISPTAVFSSPLMMSSCQHGALKSRFISREIKKRKKIAVESMIPVLSLYPGRGWCVQDGLCEDYEDRVNAVITYGW